MKIRFRNPKFNLRVFINWLVILLVLAAIGVYAYLQKTGKIEQLSPKVEQSQEASIGESTSSIQEPDLSPLPEGENKKIEIPLNPTETISQEEASLPVSQGKAYKETADFGEGITHLARKALKEYLGEHQDINLTPEHKIYIEDYIQNHIGDRWLQLGEEIDISEDLIVEAINNAQKLTPEQLQNLQQYSALVAF